MKQFKTHAAHVAFLIKAELKEKYPETKFAVKSETFAGGDSVHVSYTATLTTPKERAIKAVTDKYKAGQFDGMTDSYEYTNKGTGPTAKYISIDADTQSLRESVKSEFLNYYGINEEQYADKNSFRLNGDPIWVLENRFINNLIA